MPTHPRFAGQDLSDSDLRVISDVEFRGWHIILIPADGDEPGWAFAVGLTESFGQPECSIFGLQPETAHAILYDVGTRAQAGESLVPQERDPDLMEGLDCAFREARAKWYRPFFGTASWFYGGPTYRMLQIFWPDRENRLIPGGTAAGWSPVQRNEGHRSAFLL